MVRSSLAFWCLLITLGFSDLHAATLGIEMPDIEFASVDNNLPFENAKLLRFPGSVANLAIVKPVKKRVPIISNFACSCFGHLNTIARSNVSMKVHLTKRSSWKLYLLFHNLRYYNTEPHINIL